MAITNRERGGLMGRLISVKQLWELGIIDNETWVEKRDELLARMMDEGHIVEGVL